MKKFTLILSLLFCFNFQSFGEGTKQLMPTATDIACIQIWDSDNASRNSFTYNALDDKRLKFRINNLTEHVYFGFGNILDNPGNFTDANWNNGNADRLRFRLRRPDGTIHTANYNNVLIPNSGAGYISTHAQTVQGPAQLAGAAGYNALYFKPDVIGEWTIEFNRGSNAAVTPIRKTVIKFFDITVSSGLGSFGSNTGTYVSTGTSNTGSVLLGRLFSKAWDLNMMVNNNPFRAQMFAYTVDQVVLRVDFNGMQPFGFVVSCNSTGTQNTGDIAVDRRSIAPTAGNTSTRPEYRIFLNNPDEQAYPTGTLPVLSTPTVKVALCTEYEIVVETTNRGFVQVLLDLDETTNSCAGAGTAYSANGVYNNNSKDRLLGVFAPTAGTYSIPWNGKDGCGNLVPTGTVITVRARIQSGLTHIPLYDVEGHATGYTVTLIRPTGPPAPKLYWDDSNIGGTVELNGATSPAHTWPYAPNGTLGDVRTVNTWFYIQETVDQVTTFRADNSTFDLASNTATGVCNQDNIITFEVIYSEARFGGTTINYTLAKAVADPNYNFAPHPTASSYINDTGTYTDSDGIVKRRVFVSYKITPVGSPATLDVQLNFTAAANPASCPAPISEDRYVTCDAILPITLLSFDGTDRKEDVFLTWKTANELDNKGFYVQRSNDGKFFESIAFIEGKGTTNSLTKYEFVDTENWSGTVYYRLLQIDNNGSSSTTKTISFVRNKIPTSFVLYPNPNQAGGELNLRGITDKLSIKSLQVISITGQQILVNPNLKTTFEGIAIDLPQTISKGIYIIQFVTEFGMQNYKFVVE